MMNTPICDFVRAYAEKDPLRLHMPGHKGFGALGAEKLDITEVSGADSLYEAKGIIRDSEENASSLFGCHTFYSAEGSSLAIRAMLHLATCHARSEGRRPRIAAARNVHKTFLSAAALLDLDVDWLLHEAGGSYLAYPVTAEGLEKHFTKNGAPDAVYVTSPDYLGNLQDIGTLAKICHTHGVLLLVDNAHGAYLRFLPYAAHPMELGADLCCDSAHKTLPVLTGGAYLHISHTHSALSRGAKDALSLFGSTSPSYLILQSLDAVNPYLEETYPARLSEFVRLADGLKARLRERGMTLLGDEPLKLTIFARPLGYTGGELAAFLENKNIICEFADADHLVLMLTPEVGEAGLQRLENALAALPEKGPLAAEAPVFSLPKRALGIREAMLAPAETVPAAEACGRILAAASVGCPPAVPLVVSGEIIDADAAAAFAYYGITECSVVKE